MSGSHPQTILPKPMSNYPVLAPKPNGSGHSNGDSNETGAVQSKRELGNGQESRLLNQKYLNDEAFQRRTSQRKRAKVCCSCISLPSFIIHIMQHSSLIVKIILVAVVETGSQRARDHFPGTRSSPCGSVEAIGCTISTDPDHFYQNTQIHTTVKARNF